METPPGKDDPQAESLLMTSDFQVLAVEAACSRNWTRCSPACGWTFLPPFRRGDILWDPSGEPGFPHWEESVPFVLDYCDNWDSSQMAENGIRPEAAPAGRQEGGKPSPPRGHQRHGRPGVRVSAGAGLLGRIRRLCQLPQSGALPPIPCKGTTRCWSR